MKKNKYSDDDARMVTEEELQEVINRSSQDISDIDTIVWDEDNSDSSSVMDKDIVDSEDIKDDVKVSPKGDKRKSSDVIEDEDSSDNKKKVRKYKSIKSSKKNKVLENNNSNFKFFVHAFLVILFSFLAAFFLKRSFAFVGEENITYQENSNLDYKVYLKENDFYEDEYVGKNMVYVASLIDRIAIDYDYTFKIDTKSNIDFDYDLIGKLVISDTSKSNIFFEKEYVLLDNTHETMTEDGIHNIKKDVSIDYGQYNNLANQFKSKYGVEVDSRLIVYLNIHERSAEGNKFNLSNDSSMSLTIPLSLKAINITMDYNEVNKTSKLVREKKFAITNILFVILGFAFFISLIVVLIRFIKIILSFRVKRSKYDKYIDRLLREYDRLIVETASRPNVDNKNVVEVLKFQELLDVRDNLKLPIKYYVVRNHKECYFYINHEEELYIFRVRASDMEEDN